MAESKTLTFAVMDPPFETGRSTTLMRLLDIAVRRGHNVNVFAASQPGAWPQRGRREPYADEGPCRRDNGDGGASRDEVRLGELRHVRR
jgi:hypothetical protein